VGKRARIPASQKIGRNCVINSSIRGDDFTSRVLEDGESLLGNGEDS